MSTSLMIVQLEAYLPLTIVGATSLGTFGIPKIGKVHEVSILSQVKLKNETGLKDGQ